MIMSSYIFRVGHLATCRRTASGSAWYRRRVVSLSCTFQRAVLAAVRGTDNGSCNFHCTVLAALHGAYVCLCFVSFNKRRLFSDLCQTRVVRRYDKQMSDGKEVDKVNC